MLDYLFKGFVTVNNKHDNSTHKEPKPHHSYDTTFLVAFVLVISALLVVFMVYKSLLKRARRRAAVPDLAQLAALIQSDKSRQHANLAV